MSEHQTRNNYIDFIKGIAIILVVLGHSIQFGSGQSFYENNYYFEDTIFKAIYSFHMPLFAVVSGYLFYWSVEKRNLKQIVIKQINGLAVPAIVWNTGYCFFHYGKLVLQNRSIDLETVKTSIIYIMTNLWFLWVVMLLSIIVAILHYCFNDNIVSIVIVALITLCFPNKYNMNYLGFLYPFYMIGFLANRRGVKKMNLFVNTYGVKIFITSAVLWIVLLCFYNKETYIYTSGFGLTGRNIVQQLYYNIFRFVIGIFGCITVLGGKNRKQYTKICEIGKASMGIYIISTWMNFILLRLTVNISHHLLFNIIESLIILVSSYFVVTIIRNNIYLKRILFGGR